jgi:hypothetical protein
MNRIEKLPASTSDSPLVSVYDLLIEVARRAEQPADPDTKDTRSDDSRDDDDVAA